MATTKSVSSYVYDYLDSLEDLSIVSGWQLFDIILAQTDKHTYPSTLLRYCRNYCDMVGGEFECLDRSKSKYRYHKGAFKLNGYIPSRE